MTGPGWRQQVGRRRDRQVGVCSFLGKGLWSSERADSNKSWKAGLRGQDGMSFILNGIKRTVQGVVLTVINLAKICFTWMWANFLLFIFFILSLVKKKKKSRKSAICCKTSPPPPPPGRDSLKVFHLMFVTFLANKGAGGAQTLGVFLSSFSLK